MADILTPDLCVVGAGSGGLSVAAIAASFGVSVVLVEKGALGGDCLNVGCVPSKALIAAADRAAAVREAGAFGVEAGEPRVDMGRVRAHVRHVMAAIAPNDSAERYGAMGVRVIAAEGRFTDRRSLEAGGQLIRARRFVLATGSRPAAPPIPGLDDVPYLTNETVFDLAETPRHLLVLGGGPIGIELAQAHRRLGAPVTLVEAGRLLPREDPEMAAVVERALRRDGVVLWTAAAVERAERRGETILLHLAGGETLEGSHLLVAAGRRPSTEGLGLEAAGIAVEPAGITVDAGLRTTNRRVYAVGDCAGAGGGPYRFTHVANYHAGLVIRRALFRVPAKVDLAAIPRTIYTDPELASVGLTEAEARAAGRAFRILRWPVAENDRAQAERRPDGHVKVLVTPKGAILGCSIAAPGAGDLIPLWTLAVAKGLKIRDLAGIVMPYPTLSEVSKRAAVEFLRPSAQSPWVRRALSLLRRFG
ncbi:MAG TPA: FAD-dependent oxidoreductase [Beijerinckiaceae bacterium]